MFFDNNVGFITFDFDNKTESKKDENDLFTPVEGFLRGNMFKDEYKPYKNYNFANLTPKNKKEQLLFDIMSLGLAINDLNLYLDLHPNDDKANKIFHALVLKSCEKELEYVNMYGPLEIEESSSEQFNWVDGPWPWNDEGGSMYV